MNHPRYGRHGHARSASLLRLLVRTSDISGGAVVEGVLLFEKFTAYSLWNLKIGSMLPKIFLLDLDMHFRNRKNAAYKHRPDRSVAVPTDRTLGLFFDNVNRQEVMRLREVRLQVHSRLQPTR